MYDIEVSRPEHNFCLPNGVITSNSHSTAYAVLAYTCAYLKYHFPLEWWCSVLNNADKNEIGEKFWKYCKDFVQLPDIRYSRAEFFIEGNKIIAPLSMLQGVGVNAHDELIQSGPFKDIQDFCNKIAGVKKAKTTVNPETGKSRTGISSLNKGVVNKLIVSGVADSLFPPNLDVLAKLEMYQASLAIALNKKRPEKVEEEFKNLNSIKIYQHRKSILPVYSDFLAPMLYNKGTVGITKRNVKVGDKEIEMYSYSPQGKDLDFIVKSMGIPELEGGPIAFVNGEILKYMNDDVREDGDMVRVAVAAHVMDHKRFEYLPKTKPNQKPITQKVAAYEFLLDVDHEIFKFIRWPNRTNRETIIPEGEMNGAIVIALLSKYKDRPFTIDAIIKTEEPLEK